MKKIAVFTAVFGNPDKLQIPTIQLPDIDMFCYTDMDYKGDTPYKIVFKKFDGLSPRAKNRKIKVEIPESIFSNYEYSLYLDGNTSLLIDPIKLLDLFEEESDILLGLHPTRDCLYDEGSECIKQFPYMKQSIKAQLKKYKRDNYPRNNGLYRCTFLIRRHTKIMRTFCNAWWKEIKDYAPRDQISFPYLLWKYDIKPSLFNLDRKWKIPYFKWHKHQAVETNFVKR